MSLLHMIIIIIISQNADELMSKRRKRAKNKRVHNINIITNNQRIKVYG